MSISSLAGSQSVAQTMRPAFRPPSFDSLDKNTDGALTLDEFTLNAPKGASGAKAENRAEALFKAMDADGDGSVTNTEKDSFDTKMSEQRQSMAFMTQQIAGPSNADVFAASDTNGDGAVTLNELSSEDGASDIGGEAFQKLFDLIDADGDGSVSETESSDFLDAVKTAMGDSRPAGGSLPGGPPPDATDGEDQTTPTLLSAAQTAYKSTQQQSLLEQLASIFDSAA